MEKVLISWLDWNRDFEGKKSHAPLQKGPNYQMHQLFYKREKWDRHLLLYWAEGLQAHVDAFMGLIARDMKGKHRITPRLVPIKDPINLEEIHSRTQEVLLELKDCRIDIFSNPGFQGMQMSFFFCHISLGLRTRMLQIRLQAYTKSGRPELEEIRTQRSEQAYSLMLEQQNTHARTKAHAPQGFLMYGALGAVYERARQIAKAPRYPVLITGESGTGKENLAAHIHKSDPQADRHKFLKVNCAAFNDELLLSELFGHVKGAFSGAIHDKKGYFEKADGGTLFLDEIGDISPYAQVALLRALQEGQVTPVGSTEMKQVKLRVVAATNRNLTQMVGEGKFRQDLYYRLSTARLRLPGWQQLPARDKSELLQQLLKNVQHDVGRRLPLKVSPEARDFLFSYRMPGNIRQLEALLRSACIFYPQMETLGVETLQHELADDPQPEGGAQAQPSLLLRDVEKEHVEKVYKITGGKKQATADALGVSVNTLKKKLKDYNIVYIENG